MYLSLRKKFIITSLFITSFAFINLVAKASTDEIRILEPRDLGVVVDPVYDYFIELTKLVLDKTQEKYPNSKLVMVKNDRVTQGRRLLLVDKNYVDLIWTGTNIERERHYLAVRFPLFRGLLGYRVLLIRKNDSEKFSLIEKPEQLKKLIACQGQHWPDSDILEANGYNVTRVVHFDAMFEMLAKKRCDYFPRAIFEGAAEQRAIANEFPNIILHDGLILHYNFAFYYFVDKKNKKLAHRLNEGLNIALNDGSLMYLMKTHSVSKHLFPLSQWQEKRFFELTNYDFNNKTLVSNPMFWLDLKAIN